MAHRRVNKMVAAAAVYNRYLEEKQALDVQKQEVWIYTDASYNNQKKIGAVAFIIFNHNRKHVMSKSVVIHDKKSSTYFELLAVKKSIDTFKKRYSVDDKRFMVVSDCKSVVEVINKKSTFKKSMTQYQEIIDELTSTYDIKCIYTKAHATNRNQHSRYNQSADKMCRKAMREEVLKYQIWQNAHNSIVPIPQRQNIDSGVQ